MDLTYRHTHIQHMYTGNTDKYIYIPANLHKCNTDTYTPNLLSGSDTHVYLSKISYVCMCPCAAGGTAADACQGEVS